MSKKANWEELKILWDVCTKYGNKNADWLTLAKNDEVTSENAQEIIELIKAKDVLTAEEKLQNFISGFKFNDEIVFEAIPGARLPGIPEAKAMPDDMPDDLTDELKRIQEKHEKEMADLMGSAKVKKRIFEIKSADYIKPYYFDEIATMVAEKKQVFLFGGAGLGKSRLFEEIAKSMNKGFFTMSMAGGMRYAQVFGGNQITSKLLFMVSKFRPSDLLQALQQPIVVFIDELMSGDEDVLLGLNSVLEKNTRNIQTPIGKIDVHSECVICGSANVSGRDEYDAQYSGTKKQDDSLLDRFISIKLDYDINVENQLLIKAKLPKDAIAYLISHLARLRKRIAEFNIPFDASTRRLITAKELILDCGFSKERAFELSFLSTLSTNERSQVLGELKGKKKKKDEDEDEDED